MKDFIISLVITLLTNIYFINPYLGLLKDYWIVNGMNVIEAERRYEMYCFIFYFIVGSIVYFILWLLKKLYYRICGL